MVYRGILTDTVLFLCPSLVGAGVERRICILLNHLEQASPSIIVGLLRNEGQFLDDIPPEKTVHIRKPAWMQLLLLPIRPFETSYNFLFALYQIRRLLKQIRPRLLVTFTLETTVPAYFVRLLDSPHTIPWIISEDSNTPEAIMASIPKHWIYRRVLSIFSRIYRKAEYVIAVSNVVRRSIENHYGVSSAKVSVVHNPLDPKFRLENSANPVNGDYLLSVGRLVKVKQLDLLLKAFAQVKVVYGSRLKLIILGEGPEKKNLILLARKINIESDIVFKGFTSNPGQYMRHAKALLVTSRQEGFSNVVIEAMSVGCPVISTRSGGPEDIITHDNNGVLVNQDPHQIAQATIALLNNPQKRRQLIKAGRRDADQYLPDRVCKQFYDVITSVIERLEITNGSMLNRAGN